MPSRLPYSEKPVNRLSHGRNGSGVAHGRLCTTTIPANRLTETYILGLQRRSLILEIHVMVN